MDGFDYQQRAPIVCLRCKLVTLKQTDGIPFCPGCRKLYELRTTVRAGLLTDWKPLINQRKMHGTSCHRSWRVDLDDALLPFYVECQQRSDQGNGRDAT